MAYQTSPLSARQYYEIRTPLEALDLRLQVLMRRLRGTRRADAKHLEGGLGAVRSEIVAMSRRLDRAQEARERHRHPSPPGPPFR